VRVIPSLMFVAALTACGESAAPTTERVTVTTVEGRPAVSINGDPSTLPLLTASDTITLTGAPEDYFANNPQIVHPLSNGATIVSDGRVFGHFDADGKFTGDFVRSGAGPGELGMLANLWQTADDSLWVLDFMSRRLSRFGGDLAFGRSLQLPTALQTGYALWSGIRGDTTAVIAYGDNSPNRAPGRYNTEVSFGSWVIGQETPVMTDSRPFGESVVIPREVMGGESVISTPMGKNAQWRPVGRCMAYGFSDRWHFTLESVGADGKLVPQATIVAPHNPVSAVTDELKERVITNLIRQMPEGARAGYERALREHVPFPDSTPHFSRVLTSRDGTLWVQRYRGDATTVEDHWTVVDAGGGRAWRLTIPIGSRVLAVANGRVFVATKDEDDLETQYWLILPELAGSKPPAGCAPNPG
jgi:hypothetical protein